MYEVKESINERTINSDAVLHATPINLYRNGAYTYSSGNIRNDYGFYWEPDSFSTDRGWYLLFYPTYLNPQYYGDKGMGFALRCLGR